MNLSEQTGQGCTDFEMFLELDGLDLVEAVVVVVEVRVEVHALVCLELICIVGSGAGFSVLCSSRACW